MRVFAGLFGVLSPSAHRAWRCVKMKRLPCAGHLAREPAKQKPQRRDWGSLVPVEWAAYTTAVYPASANCVIRTAPSGNRATISSSPPIASM
jgi:hypothetical protein